MMDISGKKISIIGAVRSGLGAAKLAQKLGGVPFVSDMSDEYKMKESKKYMQENDIMYELGVHSEKVFDCDFIVTSPGVPSNADILKKAEEKSLSIYSELEFASWYCQGRIIAITGTNGKTTTTTLCSHTLNNSGFNCYLAGNIGLAFSEVTLDVQKSDFVALETSSFQLDHIHKFNPFISVILNITPDHLDRYENNLQNYVNSKLRIIANQNEDCYTILNYDDNQIPKEFNSSVNKFYFSSSNIVENGSFIEDDSFCYSLHNNKERVCSVSSLNIKGIHNRQNALAVLTIAKLVGCSNDSISRSFESFKAVEHRLEFVREYKGLKFINDSKATNVNSVWYALQSFDEPIYLILGGKDKGNDYNIIKDLVKKNVLKIYAIGSSAEKIYNFFNSELDVEIMKDLNETIFKVSKEGQKNSIVLLSPACASFDMFENYEHRGKTFKEIVLGLSE